MMGFKKENMMGVLDDVRTKKEELERQEAKNYWEGKYKYYLGAIIDESGEDDVREFDSFEIAAVVAFSMSHGFETRFEFSKMEKCLRPYIVNPYTCMVEKVVDEKGNVEYNFYNKRSMPAMAESDVRRATEEVMKSLMMYVGFSSNFEALKKLAKDFKSTYTFYTQF